MVRWCSSNARGGSLHEYLPNITELNKVWKLTSLSRPFVANGNLGLLGQRWLWLIVAIDSDYYIGFMTRIVYKLHTVYVYERPLPVCNCNLVVAVYSNLTHIPGIPGQCATITPGRLPDVTTPTCLCYLVHSPALSHDQNAAFWLVSHGIYMMQVMCLYLSPGLCAFFN